MTFKTWINAVALGACAIGVTGCVEGGERYDPGYRGPVAAVVERDRYVRNDDRRPIYQDDARYRDDRDYDRRDRFADRRGGEAGYRGGDYDRRDAGRYDGAPRGIDAGRRIEFCRRAPDAPICRDGRY